MALGQLILDCAILLATALLFRLFHLLQKRRQGPDNSPNHAEPLQVIYLPGTREEIPRNYQPFWITHAPKEGSELKSLVATERPQLRAPPDLANFADACLPQEVADMIIDDISVVGDRADRHQRLKTISLVARVFYPRTRKYLFSTTIKVYGRELEKGDERLRALCDIIDSNALVRCGGGFSNHVNPTSIVISLTGRFLVKDAGNSFHNGNLARLLRSVTLRVPNLHAMTIMVLSHGSDHSVLDWTTTSYDFRAAFHDFISSPYLEALHLSNFVNVPRHFLSESSVKTLVLRDFGLQEVNRPQDSSSKTSNPPSLESIDYMESFPLRRYMAPLSPISVQRQPSKLKALSVRLFSYQGLKELQKAMAEPVLSNVEILDIKFAVSLIDSAFVDLSQYPHVRCFNMTVGVPTIPDSGMSDVGEVTKLLRDSYPSCALAQLNITVELGIFLIAHDAGLDYQLANFDDPMEWAALDNVLARVELASIDRITLTLRVFGYGNDESQENGAQKAVDRDRFAESVAAHVRQALPKVIGVRSSHFRVMVEVRE